MTEFDQTDGADGEAVPPGVPGDATDSLAHWSPWRPFPAAASEAPRDAGVYMFREASTGAVVYAGMAGPRHGNGIRGRLAVYRTGKGAVSGLGEAALDRALADADWVGDRLTDLHAGKPQRAKEWAALAVTRAGLEVRWTSTSDAVTARTLEKRVIAALRAASLWNRAR